MNYPRPWLGGRWTFADVVEYDRLATEGLLESAASNRAMLKRNFYRMNRRTIERYASGSPFAYLIPAPEAQHDPAAVVHLLHLLRAEAAEIHVAEAPFAADGREVPAGTYVVLLAQPFGRWVKDVLEPQVYPDIRWPSPRSPLDLPYDVTAWSLGMLMGVETVRVDEPFEARLRPVDSTGPPAGRVSGTASARTWLLQGDSNRSAVAVKPPAGRRGVRRLGPRPARGGGGGGARDPSNPPRDPGGARRGAGAGGRAGAADRTRVRGPRAAERGCAASAPPAPSGRSSSPGEAIAMPAGRAGCSSSTSLRTGGCGTRTCARPTSSIVSTF